MERARREGEGGARVDGEQGEAVEATVWEAMAGGRGVGEDEGDIGRRANRSRGMSSLGHVADAAAANERD